jgi:formate hydrogenlyase subunit 6/NADH:ubiquinone oxidoreductase subunit I
MIRPGRMIRQVLDSLRRKAATTRYPFVKAEMPKDFRGKIRFTPEKCIGCKACMRDCPAGAITIRQVGEVPPPPDSPTGKPVKKFEAEFDLSRCIYCAQCVDSCPRDALEATPEFELAQQDRTKLKVVFHGDSPDNDKNKPATKT